MKLLVVDIKNPEQTQYLDPTTIKYFMWGKKIHNYPMFAVDKYWNAKPIVTTTAECTKLQEEVMEQLKEKTYVRKFLIEVEVTEALKDAELYEIDDQYNEGWYTPEGLFDSGVIRYEIEELSPDFQL
jgi:23S rRNA G2069 N7-methylase RlmK/C1962 C5-methylase RlmI